MTPSTMITMVSTKPDRNGSSKPHVPSSIPLPPDIRSQELRQLERICAIGSLVARAVIAETGYVQSA